MPLFRRKPEPVQHVFTFTTRPTGYERRKLTDAELAMLGSRGVTDWQGKPPSDASYGGSHRWLRDERAKRFLYECGGGAFEIPEYFHFGSRLADVRIESGGGGSRGISYGKTPEGLTSAHRYVRTSVVRGVPYPSLTREIAEAFAADFRENGGEDYGEYTIEFR